jgi:bacterioferritin-associated ferredoxin
MYVCICNAIRESELRDAAHELHGDAEMLYIALGYEPQCRQCLSAAEKIVAQERGTADMGRMMPL